MKYAIAICVIMLTACGESSDGWPYDAVAQAHMEEANRICAVNDGVKVIYGRTWRKEGVVTKYTGTIVCGNGGEFRMEKRAK